MMRLGKIVVITAVGPFHQASGTMSNKRMSCPTLGVSDANSRHNDKPNSIAPESVMLDVSLGAGRTFHIRKNATTGEDITQVMAHGSAIAFTRFFNETYQHAVMAGAKPRASIVFRDIADVLNDAVLVRLIAKAKAAKARRDKAKAKKDGKAIKMPTKKDDLIKELMKL